MFLPKSARGHGIGFNIAAHEPDGLCGNSCLHFFCTEATSRDVPRVFRAVDIYLCGAYTSWETTRNE